MIVTFTIPDCPECCDPCDFDSATMVISSTDIPPCETACKFGFEGTKYFQVVSGDLSGAFAMTGADGELTSYTPNRFVVRVYDQGADCTGDFQDITCGMLITLSCDATNSPGPLTARAWLTVGAPENLVYQIFQVPFPIGGFSFDEVVEIPGCGDLTVSP